MSREKDEKIMVWAIFGAKLFSTCQRRQYMAIITSPEGRVIGTGYNGGPSGMPHCTEGACPRAQLPQPRIVEAGPEGATYSAPRYEDVGHPDHDDCIAIHSEVNALLHSDPALRRGGTLYVNGVPCYACAKNMANAHLARVVYFDDESRDSKGLDLLREVGIELTPIAPNQPGLGIWPRSDQ